MKKKLLAGLIAWMVLYLIGCGDGVLSPSSDNRKEFKQEVEMLRPAARILLLSVLLHHFREDTDRSRDAYGDPYLERARHLLYSDRGAVAGYPIPYVSETERYTVQRAVTLVYPEYVHWGIREVMKTIEKNP